MSKEHYFSEIIKDLELSFWDERGLGARYRTTLVGVNYFKDKYGSSLTGKDWRSTAQNVIDVLIKEGLVKDIEFRGKDHVLKVEFKECLHLEVERGLAAKGVPPFSCPCANVLMYYVDSLLGSASELVSIEIRGNRCMVTFAIVGSTLEEV